MSPSEGEFSLSAGVIRFKEEANAVSMGIQGPIINSVPSNKKRKKKKKQALRDWKEKVACAVKAERGGAPWSPHDLYAVTLEFRFHRHPNQILDVDNFVKPVLDGLAAGLFCPEDTDPREIPRFDINHGVDDSNFRTLLIHRSPDAPSRDQERVDVFVSSTRPL